MNALDRKSNRHSAALRCLAFGMLLFSLRGFCQTGSSAEFHKTFTVTNAEPVKLAVGVSKGDVEIVYSRDGEVSVSLFAQASADLRVDENYFRIVLSAEQMGNKITIQNVPNLAYPEENVKLRFRIEVPYRTEVRTDVKEGKQILRGVTGPAGMKAGRGDVSVSYVSSSVRVEAERANLDFQMIGAPVEAWTANGNISGERIPKGIRAETGDGDIKLMVVGSSEAIVKAGNGRIEIGGARDTLTATTDSGDLSVQAVPHNGWKLNSKSGTIRLELPLQAGFELEASSESGKLQFERNDLPSVAADAHYVFQKINGGGTKIQARTGSGALWIR